MVAISGLTSAAPLAAVIFLVTIGLVIARPRGMEVSTWSYIRVRLIVTPVTILAALGVGLLLGVPW